MTWFSSDVRSTATVTASRDAVWAALTDPELLPTLTPFLQRIDVDGDHWTWQLSKVPILTSKVSPSFTEKMTFEEPEKITFEHDPPAAGERERAGVEGWYRLTEAPRGTTLEISLGVRVDLPMAKLAKPAVHAALKTVLAGMGRTFSQRLLRHLDAHDVQG